MNQVILLKNLLAVYLLTGNHYNLLDYLVNSFYRPLFILFPYLARIFAKGQDDKFLKSICKFPCFVSDTHLTTFEHLVNLFYFLSITCFSYDLSGCLLGTA
nr:MAG TPA: hypothetical protein [Caudoviricetes sp.]